MVCGFAVWSSRANLESSRRAIAAAVLSDDYAEVGNAVIIQQSLLRQYRLDPTGQIRAQYEAAEARPLAAIRVVRSDGDAADRAAAERALTELESSNSAIDRLFDALDRRDPAAAARIERDEVNAPLDRIKNTVIAAETRQNQRAEQALKELQKVQTFAATATPIVFGVGLLLILLFSAALRRVRRQLRQQRHTAAHDSLHDPLTGLPNRELLAGLFTQALQRGRRDGTPTGLLVLDLDRFKEINDTLGHHCGDQLLTQIGPRLRAALRDEDAVARLGGDEFAVLLPHVADLDSAVLVAEKLRHALSIPFPVLGLDLDVQASVGVVLSGPHGQDAGTLLQHADIAMYVAKRTDIGVFAYNPAADARSPDKLTLLSELRHALDRHQLLLHYQPKVSLGTGAMCGVEALIRWPHAQRGMVPPDSFIPLAERTGLIGPLTDYVLDAALSQVRAWGDQGLRIPVAVNISARNLLDDRLADTIVNLLRRHHLTADLLQLEVTETALMTEPDTARAMLYRLHDAGIRIAIDDFGVGHTSLGQLRTLPVSELKIDRSFVTTMDTDGTNAHIVDTIIDLAHHLGMSVVAEGVETDSTLNALRRVDCDIAQGYHISGALPAAELTTWHHQHQNRLPTSTP